MRLANVPITTSLELSCSAITLRAAFSHVFLFRELATLFSSPPSDLESQPSVATQMADITEEMQNAPDDWSVASEPAITEVGAAAVWSCCHRPHPPRPGPRPACPLSEQ